MNGHLGRHGGTIATEPPVQQLWAVGQATGRCGIPQCGGCIKPAAIIAFQRSIGAAGEAVNAASQIKNRAERRMGEELAKAEKATGAAQPGTARGTTRSADPTASPLTLAEIGITKDQSSRFQKLAAIPEDTYEAVVEAHMEAREELVARGEAEIIAALRPPVRSGKQSHPAFAPEILEILWRELPVADVGRRSLGGTLHVFPSAVADVSACIHQARTLPDGGNRGRVGDWRRPRPPLKK